MPTYSTYYPGETLSLTAEFSFDPNLGKDTAIITNYKVSPPDLPPLVKRKRGRPPKAKVEEDILLETIEEEEVAPVAEIKEKPAKKETRDRKIQASRKAIQEAEVVYARLLGSSLAKAAKSDDDEESDAPEKVRFRGWEDGPPKLRKQTIMTQDGIEVIYMNYN